MKVTSCNWLSDHRSAHANVCQVPCPPRRRSNSSFPQGPWDASPWQIACSPLASSCRRHSRVWLWVGGSKQQQNLCESKRIRCKNQLWITGQHSHMDTKYNSCPRDQDNASFADAKPGKKQTYTHTAPLSPAIAEYHCHIHRPTPPPPSPLTPIATGINQDDEQFHSQEIMAWECEAIKEDYRAVA